MKAARFKKLALILVLAALVASVGMNLSQYRREMIYRKLPAEIANEMGAWLYRQKESCDTGGLIADYSWTRYSRPTGWYHHEDDYFVDPDPIELETVTILLKKHSQITDICQLAGRLAEGFRKESDHRIQPKYFSLVSIQEPEEGKTVWMEYLVDVSDEYRVDEEIERVTERLQAAPGGHVLIVAGE